MLSDIRGDNDSVKVVYALDIKVNGVWETLTETCLTFNQAVDQANKIYASGEAVRIMAWTQADGYWLVAIYQ